LLIVMSLLELPYLPFLCDWLIWVPGMMACIALVLSTQWSCPHQACWTDLVSPVYVIGSDNCWILPMLLVTSHS
jgi:hypothetical protein